jgi:hypothetical protein
MGVDDHKHANAHILLAAVGQLITNPNGIKCGQKVLK